ncbi:MAG: molybdenum cofactor guanylyltransferase [Gammaproteobacteria bacterium]
MSSPGPEQITGVVLAGGQSRRMNGVNKALLLHSSKPLFQYAVENLSTCCNDVLVNASRDRAAFEELGFAVFDDGDFADCGPVAGIHASLARASTSFVAFAACDQLALPAKVYETLASHVSDNRGVYACGTEDVVPTCAILPTGLLSVARSALQSNELALMTFMRAHAQAIQFDDVEFANLNFRHQFRHQVEPK